MNENLSRPASPKNGDKRINKDETIDVFRYGSWIRQKPKPEKKSSFY